MFNEFEEIVDPDSVGKLENPINVNELLANVKSLSSASTDRVTTLLLGIDLQNDFMDNGALGVPGAIEDLKRLLKWYFEYLMKFTATRLSKDTHNVYQIFHPACWIDTDGNHPSPLTEITLDDVDNLVWAPVVNPIGARDYVMNLEKLGRKTLRIWTYHCIQGTTGCAIDNQLMNLGMYHSIARKSRLNVMVKGQDPMSEMYGIFKPEYSPTSEINVKVLDAIASFDRVVITGQAKSHCVLESIQQMLEYYEDDKDTIRKIFILEDTMSVIPGFEDETEQAFNDFRSKGVNLVSTEDFKL